MPWITLHPPEISLSLSRMLLLATACLGFGVANPTVASGQVSGDGGTQTLAFDRPESWAMKYFTSVTLLTGIGVPDYAEKGSIKVAFESGWIPTLSASQRRVGFNGTKTEALNRSSLFGRIRVRLGLGSGMTIEAAYVPPVKLNGARPNLLSISVSRPVFVRDRWRVSGRAYAQVGSISGDFTCAEAEIGNPSDTAFNCLEASNDEISQRYLGLEMGLAGGDWLGPLEPHATVGLNYLDLEFQVRARYNEVTDRALLVTDGITVFGTAGLSYPFGDGFSLSGEAFYSPLGVQGRNQGTDGIGEAQHSDGLFNVRVLLSYRLR